MDINASVNEDQSDWQAEFEKSLSEDKDEKEERPSSSSSSSIGEIGFNDDLLCPHGWCRK